MNASDFTVLMAVYHGDSPILFKMAIDSVYSNKLLPIKFIVVADGPLTQELEEVLRLYATYPSFCVIRIEKNSGLSCALNLGLRSVNTKYTVRADSDDFSTPDRFHKLIAVLESGFDIVGSSILEVDKNGESIAIRRPPLTQEEIFVFARKRNPFNHMSVGFRTAAVIGVGGYPSIHLKEDYGLWASLIASGAYVCNIDEVLVNATTGRDMYRRRGGLKYAIAEVDMQRHLVRVGLKAWPSAIVDGLLRALIFILPSRIREFVYLRYLRSSAG